MARKKKAEVPEQAEPIVAPPRYVETLDSQRYFVIMRISEWVYLCGQLGYVGAASPMYCVPIDECRDITEEIERAQSKVDADLAE